MHVSDALTTRSLILVVDDTESVRWIFARTFLHAGFHVLTAPGAADALRLLDQFQARPNLAVIDLYMPVVSGEELAAELSSRHPRLPFLFVSAFGHGPDAVLPGLLLEKPFSLEVLCRIATHVLALSTQAAMVP
jgi:DNA-binding NtrC family response regulator